jgi:XTP/dITP diphosphohydrolase
LRLFFGILTFKKIHIYILKTLIFATHNAHKAAEIDKLLQHSGIQVSSLSEIGFHDEIPEEQDTIIGNAIQKAQYIFERTGKAVFADDTGLMVDALHGAPGVFSARYAGEKATYAQNVEKLLNELKGKTNRKAYFQTAIALIWEGKTHIFKGEIHGTILEEGRGEGGFGYDPIFLPDSYTQTFAEMPLSLKNEISHRALAVKQLLAFFEKL